MCDKSQYSGVESQKRHKLSPGNFIELPIKQCLGAVSTVKPDFVQYLPMDTHFQIPMRRPGGLPEAHHVDSIFPGGSSTKNKISLIAWGAMPLPIGVLPTCFYWAACRCFHSDKAPGYRHAPGAPVPRVDQPRWCVGSLDYRVGNGK